MSSTICRRLSSETCVFTSSPQSFFFGLEILGHQLGDDLVLLPDLGFELFDLLFCSRRLRAALAIEGPLGILEEQRLPGIEPAGSDVILLADIGNGAAFDEVELEDFRFLGGTQSPPGVVLGLLLHGFGWL